MRGGAYVKATIRRDPRDVPRLKGLVEGMRVEEATLHSARDGKKARHSACVSQWMGGEDERWRVRIG